MSEMTSKDNEIIEKNLKYIGLDLNQIPDFLMQYEPLNFRPLKSYDDIIYKVYRYIDVNDIEILITPTDRLTDLQEKYKLASPLYTYLDTNSEKDIERHAQFLKLIANIDEEKIEQIEKEQLRIKEQIPYQVKYPNHYIWQIYYSDAVKKYFMLVPTNEQDNSALFYLLKKQINSKKEKKKETIFAPITHLEYSGQFLTKTEINDIENYLWYFTKEWVSIYEVYNKENKMNIQIIGSTEVYEKTRSNYRIILNSKEDAINFYKVLKAMFILSTGVPNIYKFTCKIEENGDIGFYNDQTKLTYDRLPEFINTEVQNKTENIKSEAAEKIKLEKRLKRFNRLIEELTQDYLARQRQISTFLECKKTFFGRVKYFFKKKKEVPENIKKESLREKEENPETQELQNIYEKKEQYTIEDLINICTKLQEKEKENTNLKLDIHAIETKKEILTKKIENADIYIKEIDSHKKSIFEFWKYTSKDEVQTLNEGEEQDEKKEKISKYFNYETDLEDLGKMIDELQRRKLSKNETDAILAVQFDPKTIAELEKEKYDEKYILNQKVIEKELEKLKKEYESNLEYINIKDIDLFGGLSDDKTKVKMIHNQKHREIEKDKFKILNVNLETTVENYIDTMKHYINLIVEASNKITTPYNMSLYKIKTKKKIEGIEILNINPQNELKKAIETKKDKVNMCRININENMPILFYTNIIFYDNFNQTLPVGMDLSSEVLLNLRKMTLKEPKEESFYMNFELNEFDIKTIQIQVYEYTANIE